jgi:hypothetical protein
MVNHFAGQAVNLLNRKLGFFYAYTFIYWRLPIRRYFALWSGTHYL